MFDYNLRMATAAPTLPFSEPTRRWFAQAFGQPTPAQAEGWPRDRTAASTS